MFDIGFSELLLFGVIALIVLGPEKLPQAARTAGQWYGKLRRAISTLQSEIEAELDLAETRQLMQQELAKIRETEADMRREMADMRGSIKEFESSQNKDMSGKDNNINNGVTADIKPSIPNHSDYSDHSQDQKALASHNAEQNTQPIMTRPWENMWFRLGTYDKARRLPTPPYLPNYQADILLHVDLNKISHSNYDTYDSKNISASKNISEAD